MGLIDDLGPGPLAIDTAIFIYFIEEAPRFLPLVVPLFEEADAGRRHATVRKSTGVQPLRVALRMIGPSPGAARHPPHASGTCADQNP